MPEGFIKRLPRLIGSALTTPEPLDFSTGPTGMPQGPNLLESMLQSGIAAAGTPNQTGGPTDIFAAMGAGQNRLSQIKTERLKEFQQQRQQEQEDLGIQTEMMSKGRLVRGGMVEEEEAIPEGGTVKISRPVDTKRLVKHKGRDGRLLEVEVYSPDEFRKMALEQKRLEEEMKSRLQQAENAAKAQAEAEAKRTAAARDLQQFGVPVPEQIATLMGITPGTLVMPDQLDDYLRAANEFQKQASETGEKVKEVEKSYDDQGNLTVTPIFEGPGGAFRVGTPVQPGVKGKSRPSDVKSPAAEAQEIRIAQSKRALDRQDQQNALVDAVMENPNYYQDLTPTARTAIGPELVKRGFSNFGKTLSSTEINKMADQRFAVKSLEELRDILEDNEQYIGPLAGLQALNPYSEGRKAQADIDRVKQRVGKILEGGVLRKEDEAKYTRILATLRDEPATAIYKVSQMIESFGHDAEIYREELGKAGRRLGGDTGGSPKPAEAASGGGEPVPAVGTVKNGWSFKGGDPNNKNNWEKVKKVQ